MPGRAKYVHVLGAFVALLPACLMPALAAAGAGARLRAGAFDPPAAAAELGLRSSLGGPLELKQLRGRVVLIEFGFTNCPSVCPTTLAVLAQARKRLGPMARDVQVLFITVDPERDDPARLRAYLRGFDPSFIGGTGTPAQLAAVRQRYGATARRKPAGEGYTVGHSSSVYVIDRKGRLRALMPYGTGATDYVHDLRILLAE